jgi:hypothetical protein
MSTMATKYTREVLAPLVPQARSYAEVLRALGLRQTGGSQRNIRMLIGRYGIDTTHFLGQAHGRGRPSQNRLGPDDLLVQDRLETGARERGSRLRRALLDSGVPEQCAECGVVPIWNGKTLRLQVDHMNGDFTDNRKSNLRFMCPNCHSQTDNFSIYNK